METAYLYHNIKCLAKAKNIKMSEIEYPLKPGWISRLYRRKAMDKLSIGCVYNAAKLFGVSVEDLIEKDLASEYQYDAITNEIKRLREEADRLESKLDGESNDDRK